QGEKGISPSRVQQGQAETDSGSSDPYCGVKVDNEVVARAATVWKSLNPFWGEEITLLLPRGFHSPTWPPRDASGASDPFGRVSCCGHTLGTAVVKKTRLPSWDEVLEFELPEGELGEAVLSVELWDWDIVGKNDSLGRVEFFLDTLCPGLTRGWFHLLPLPSTTGDHGGQLGALRLAVRLLEDTVLPSHHYQPLIQLLTEPILCPAQVVWRPSGRGLQVGEALLGQGLAVLLLDYLTSHELARTTDPNTLLRSNSLASKSTEQFMKVVGLPYLHELLKPVLNRIFEEKKHVELDPGKMELSRGRRISFRGSLSEAQVQESSLELLKGYLGDIVHAIVGLVDKCPLPMRVAFQQLRRRVEQRFPSAQHEVGPTAGLGVCAVLLHHGFLFLHFFAPTVLTPKLFGLREQCTEPGTGPTLLLLAKVGTARGHHGGEGHRGRVGTSGRDGDTDEDTREGWGHWGRVGTPGRNGDIGEGWGHEGRVGTLENDGDLGERWGHQGGVGTLGRCAPSLLSPQSAPELWQWLWALCQATSANRDMLPTFHPGTFHPGVWLSPCPHSVLGSARVQPCPRPAVAAQSLCGHLR
uniref:Uncharacterized protein n=1 Tax=Geospiza parvula TaxID=87175 RepID=A0A8U8B3K8_GEOPR